MGQLWTAAFERQTRAAFGLPAAAVAPVLAAIAAAAPRAPGRYRASPGRSRLARLWKVICKPATHYRILRSPDRVVLVREILPVIARHSARTLFVGVRRYTRRYPAILKRFGGSCWTSDIDPHAAAWGSAARHVTGDIRRIDESFALPCFSALICNGVFGFGVDGAEMQHDAFASMAKVVRPGGWLLLGWNTDRTADPLEDPRWLAWFEPADLESLPTRRRIPGTTHVYDLLRRSGPPV